MRTRKELEEELSTVMFQGKEYHPTQYMTLARIFTLHVNTKGITNLLYFGDYFTFVDRITGEVETVTAISG